MIIDEIKKANIDAMKAKNANLRGIYSVIINKYMQATIEARTTGKEVSDDEVIKIIQKTIKELIEEAENYKKVGNSNEELKIMQQKLVLESYLPKMLTEEEIKNIILTLEDKSLPTVMKHFKESFGSSVDLKIVSQVLKTL